MSNTITVKISGERLAAMYDNDMAIWKTPGSNAPYWATHNSFAEDLCFGDASDVVEAWNEQNGDCLDIDDVRNEEGEIEVLLSY